MFDAGKSKLELEVEGQNVKIEQLQGENKECKVKIEELEKLLQVIVYYYRLKSFLSAFSMRMLIFFVH